MRGVLEILVFNMASSSSEGSGETTHLCSLT